SSPMKPRKGRARKFNWQAAQSTLRMIEWRSRLNSSKLKSLNRRASWRRFWRACDAAWKCWWRLRPARLTAATETRRCLSAESENIQRLEGPNHRRGERGSGFYLECSLSLWERSGVRVQRRDIRITTLFLLVLRSAAGKNTKAGLALSPHPNHLPKGEGDFDE